MFDQSREYVSLRVLAIIPIILFVPTLAITAVNSDSRLSDGLGILFHIAAIFIVARLPGPEWARAAGYGWLTLDVACGAMTIQGVPHDIAFPVRLAGHILAAIWLITSSMLTRFRDIQVVGVLTALMLAAYTFFGHGLSENLLVPPGLTTIVWFALLSWHSKPAPDGSVSLGPVVPVNA